MHERGLSIGGYGLRLALIAGAQRVILARDEIDRINVFPVADGDTGTNLAFTFHAMLGGMRDMRSGDVGVVLRQAAFDAIDGARGNSGAILAQFFQGLAQSVGSAKRLTLAQLAEALTTAALSARAALAEPKEGTIISVISDFAESTTRALRRGARGLREWVDLMIVSARQSLANTPRQLAVLRKARVVDAGAKGFVEFLEGVAAFAREGRKRRPIIEAGAPSESNQAHHHDLGPVRFRYCTECLVRTEMVDLSTVRAALSALTLDSLVTVAGAQRLKIHAHIDEPAQLFEVAARFGDVVQRKADDMQAQARAMSVARPTAIVVDSAADVPPELLRTLGIHVVPVRVNFGSEEFIDRITLSSDEMFQRMVDGGVPRTSQPPAGEFRRLYDQLASHHRDIVSLQISSRLSGTWQAAVAAAAHGGDGKVRVLDSQNASAGQGLLALRAARMAQAGCSGAEIVAAIEAVRAQAMTFAVLPDLRYACAGGRLPGWTRWWTERLGLVLEIAMRADGKIGPKGAFFGRGDWVPRFTSRLLRRLAGAQKLELLVADCQNPVAGERCAALLREALGPRLASLHRVQAGTALGAHAGPGALIVGALPAETA